MKYAGSATTLGRCIHESVFFSVQKALVQYELGIHSHTFFIYSSVEGTMDRMDKR